MTLVKVCGIRLEEDLEVALDAGADLVGFIFVPWSPRVVEPEAAARLAAQVPQSV